MECRSEERRLPTAALKPDAEADSACRPAAAADAANDPADGPPIMDSAPSTPLKLELSLPLLLMLLAVALPAAAAVEGWPIAEDENVVPLAAKVRGGFLALARAALRADAAATLGLRHAASRDDVTPRGAATGESSSSASRSEPVLAREDER